MIRNFFESCDYEHGYSKALSDVKNFIISHSNLMKYERMFNAKDIMALLSFLEQNRDEFMKWGEHLELRYKREGKKLSFSLDKTADK